MYTPTCAKAGAAIAEAKMRLAIHFVFIVLSSYNNLTYDANPAGGERFRPLFAANGAFASNPFWGM
jgi:hypothetical protein